MIIATNLIVEKVCGDSQKVQGGYCLVSRRCKGDQLHNFLKRGRVVEAFVHIFLFFFSYFYFGFSYFRLE